MEGHSCAWEGYYGRIVSLALGALLGWGFHVRVPELCVRECDFEYAST